MNRYCKKIINIGDRCNVKKDVFFCSSKEYIKYVGVVITAILKNNDNDYNFHIFTNEIFKMDRENFEKISYSHKVNINIYFVKEEIDKLFNNVENVLVRFPSVLCFKFIAPKVLEEISDKALYLDADLLIKKGLNDIFKIDLKNNVCAAVEDVSSEDLSKTWNLEKYFNAGVLLIDIKKWNEQNLTKKCFEILNDRNWIYLDQDILNIVLNGKVKYLSAIYNYQYSLSRIFNRGYSSCELKKDVIIYHFIGSDKPWCTWVHYIDIVKEYIYIYIKYRFGII